MLKQNWRVISVLERIGDNAIIIAAFVGAYFGRQSLIFWNEEFNLGFHFEGESLFPLADYSVVLMVGLVGYWVTLNAMGAYGSMRLSSVWRLFRLAFLSSITVFGVVAAALFVLKFPISRSFIALFVLLSGCGLALQRYAVLKFLRYWRRKGRNFRNVIVCGVGDQAVQLTRELSRRPELGIHVRGFADLREEPVDRRAVVEALRRELADCVQIGRLLVGVDDVCRALKDYAIDEVIFADVISVMPQVEEMIMVCVEQGVQTTIAADIFSVGLVNSGISYFAGLPLIHFQTTPDDSWALWCKRILDVSVSGALLVLLAPIFILIALGVKTTKGPILFKQTRVGLNGRLFQMYKFRSMFVGAERDLALLRRLNEMKGPAFKMKNDPRITPCGRFLRRFSLDELPQLWNVFIGDMSLVGPRPPIPGEVSLYERKTRRRLSMRPGLTCTWQVSGRNNIEDFNDWVALDLHYIDNWSFGNDLVLLIRTIPAVLLGTGAR